MDKYHLCDLKIVGKKRVLLDVMTIECRVWGMDSNNQHIKNRVLVLENEED